MSTLRVNTITDAAGTGDTDAAQIGVGQTWQAVTRTSGTTYTNNTGRPIMVNYNISGSGSASCSVTAVVGGVGPITFVAVQAGTGPSGAAGQLIIPVGATYVFTETNVTTRTVYELR